MPRQFVGDSACLRRAVAVLERVAATDVTVLILGETGTGKELAARTVHETSPRAAGPFVAVNCAALPDHLVESELFGHEPGAFTGAIRRRVGRLEQASGGTILFDEVGDLPLPAQAKLLRVLQERVIERLGGDGSIPVDVRVLAATNRDLAADVAARRFRADLYYRLAVVSVRLPPLRERLDDLACLVRHFLDGAMRRSGKHGVHLTAEAEQRLGAHAWPGNVREVENLCAKVVALAPDGGEVGVEDLELDGGDEPPHSALPSADLRAILDYCEREILRRMLARNQGNRTRTAEALGISRQALQQKLARRLLRA